MQSNCNLGLKQISEKIANSLHFVVPLPLKMLLKVPDFLSQGVNVSVEHRDGHRGLARLGADAAASPEDTQTHMQRLYFSHAVEYELMWHTEPLRG